MFCECGCGQITTMADKTARRDHRVKGEYIRFIRGHNSRSNHPILGRKHSDDTRKKMKESHNPWQVGEKHPMFGKKQSEESRRRMSASHKNIPLSEKHCQSIGETSKRAWARKSKEERERWAQAISKGEKGKFVTEETKLNISKAKKGKRPSPRTEFTSELMKARYQDPLYIEKMKKAWNRKPNKAEQILADILEKQYPGQWRYTGDFSLMINRKCPDFVNCNGKKLIIELFGEHWHKGEDPKERENIFKPFGYRTLIVWAGELRNRDKLKSKLEAFCLGHEISALTEGGCRDGG